MVRIYKKKEYNIYSDKNGFIIHNTKKEFSTGHTHINNYKTATFLIDLSIHENIPKHLSKYLLESLARITENKTYKEKIRKIIKSMK